VNGVTTVLEQGTARDAETNAQSIKTVGTERRVSRPSLVNFCLTGPHACSRSGLSAIAELFHTRDAMHSLSSSATAKLREPCRAFEYSLAV